MNLWETFTTLPRPSNKGFYSAEPTSRRFRVGRTYENHPAVLIEFPSGTYSSSRRSLATLEYSPPSFVELTVSEGPPKRAQFAIITCKSTDDDLGAYFFRIVSALLEDEQTLASEATFESALDRLVALFRSLAKPGFRTIQGLWAELAIILWAADPVAAVSSWHSSPRGLHDFSAGGHRIEVKATLKALREHTFSLDQLATLSPGFTLVASVMMREHNSGASVFDLVEGIRLRVGHVRESAARLEAIVVESLGSGWRDAGDLRFSLEDARESLRIFAASDVPTVTQPLPPQVKDVRFTADLSAAPSLELASARALAPLFEQVLATEAAGSL